MCCNFKVQICLIASAALPEIMNYSSSQNINYVKSVCNKTCRFKSHLYLSFVLAAFILR
jgi:hypothetical protein